MTASLLYSTVLLVAVCRSADCGKSSDGMIHFDGMDFPMSVHNSTDAMKYLNRFGYMSKMEPNMDMNSPMMKSVIMDYQRFMGLNESGTLDHKTMAMMNMPRCGVPDNLLARTNRTYQMNLKKRFRRYSLQGSVWDKKDITWKVSDYSKRGNLRGRERDIERLMEYALNEWSRNSALNFIKETSDKKAMIEIGFRRWDHKDGNPFDGQGRTLAHAFFPQFGGDTHFDDDERWSIDGGHGVDLLSVAVHEFGHALGLGHSDKKDALMYPTYAGKRTRLQRDDIKGIEMLYGKRAAQRRVVSYLDANERKMPKAKTSAPDLCADFRIDAADCNNQDQCFFFRDEYIWRIADDTGIYPGYPKLISDIFPGFRGKVDAVVTDENSDRTYLFRKNRVWVYGEPMKPAITADEPIENVIRGFKTNYLDASTRWGLNGKVYFYKGNKYWRFESERGASSISRRYPQSIESWKGLPDGIDAAMFWPKTGKTYFFKGSQYYRFNDLTSSVDRANPAFPRDATRWWLKCSRGRSGRLNELEDNSCKGRKCIQEMNESNDPSSTSFFKKVTNGLSKLGNALSDVFQPRSFSDIFGK